MKEVPVGRKGHVALIDEDNYEAGARLGLYRWYLGRGGYAQRAASDGMVKMEWLVLGIPPRGQVVDHRDGNKLNNQRDNLRFVSNSENSTNADRKPGFETGFLGVRQMSDGTYVGRVRKLETVDVTKKYDCAEEAARARDAFALVLHGEHGVYNFPQRALGRLCRLAESAMRKRCDCGNCSTSKAPARP